VEHRQVRLEDRGVLPAELGADRVAIPLHLAGRLGHGRGEAGELGVDGAPLDEPARNPEALAVEDESLADRDAG